MRTGRLPGLVLRLGGGEAGVGGRSGALAPRGFASAGGDGDDEGAVASVDFSLGCSGFLVLEVTVFLDDAIFGASLLRGELAFLSKGDVGAVLPGFTAFAFFGVTTSVAGTGFASAFFVRGRRTGIFFALAVFDSDFFFMVAGHTHHPRAAVSTFAEGACNRKYDFRQKVVCGRPRKGFSIRRALGRQG